MATHTTKQQVIDQSAHFAAAFLPVFLLLIYPHPIMAALVGGYIGLVRELSQHNTLNPKVLGTGSWTDIAFWALGGFVAFLVV